jgi:hypothetical protein
VEIGYTSTPPYASILGIVINPLKQNQPTKQKASTILHSFVRNAFEAEGFALELNGTYQLLIYSDVINLLSENVNNTKKPKFV